MKKGIKVLKIGGPDELLDFLSQLEKGDTSKLEELMEKVGEENHCNDPLCLSCCLGQNNDSPEKAVDAAVATFALLPREEMNKMAGLMFGLISAMFLESESPVDREIARKWGAVKGLFRKNNEKFAFATDPGNEGEGAKH